MMEDGGTILVVEDDPASLRLLVKVLMGEGHRVLPVDGGELALAAAAANLPELILLDMQMPGLDGLEVCHRLKARPETREVPIIFISAFGETASRVEGLKSGAVDFINKPFQREELLVRVHIHLELRRLRVRLESQSAALRQINQQLEGELVERARAEQALLEKNTELAVALARVRSLSGLLPICASCKGIRDDKGYWSQVETYIQEHSEATFTHGLCPECMVKLYPELEEAENPTSSP